jgi:hypothetical protein
MAAKQQAPAHNRAPPATNPAGRSESSELKGSELTPEARRRVALAAFYRAEARGFSPGHELEDWLEAEREVEGIDSGRECAGGLPPSPEERQPSPDDPAAAPKRAASKRTKTTRGAPIQARNREDQS